jgi:hypothetical protein
LEIGSEIPTREELYAQFQRKSAFDGNKRQLCVSRSVSGIVWVPTTLKRSFLEIQMKKFLALAVVAVLSVAAIGCGGNPTSPSTGAKATTK